MHQWENSMKILLHGNTECPTKTMFSNFPDLSFIFLIAIIFRTGYGPRPCYPSVQSSWCGSKSPENRCQIYGRFLICHGFGVYEFTEAPNEAAKIVRRVQALSFFRVFRAEMKGNWVATGNPEMPRNLRSHVYRWENSPTTWGDWWFFITIEKSNQ